MNEQLIIKAIIEVEAAKELLETKIVNLKKICRKALEKSAGVSTPASRKGRKGLSEKEEAELIAKSRLRRIRKIVA